MFVAGVLGVVNGVVLGVLDDFGWVALGVLDCCLGPIAIIQKRARLEAPNVHGPSACSVPFRQSTVELANLRPLAGHVSKQSAADPKLRHFW